MSSTRFWLACAMTIGLGCSGRERPRLYSVVALPGDKASDCLQLREPSLASLPPETIQKLRPASDEYVWLVGESMEGPSGIAGFVGSLTGQSSLVSLTSSRGGPSTTRAIATVESGHVTQTFFGTPLTPPFPNDDGVQLSLSFEARTVDGNALSTASAVLSVIPSGPQYAQLFSAITGPTKDRQKAEVYAQTYVMADPRTCHSGACQTLIAEQRLVMIAEDPRHEAAKLSSSLCLRGPRLIERTSGHDYDGAYAVLRVAHARLPEEALGDGLASRLATLSRCDQSFAPSLAVQALEALEPSTLRGTDREPMRRLLEDAVYAARAAGIEERLEAEMRLTVSAQGVCDVTPQDGIVCARARAIKACATSRLGPSVALRESYRRARASLTRLETAATCDERSRLLVEADVDAVGLAAMVRDARLEGRCASSGVGLMCDPFPDTSRRSRLAVSDAQDLLYRECFCPAVQRVAGDEAGLPEIRETLRCDAVPEEFTLPHRTETPLREADVRRWQDARTRSVPGWTTQQCPACSRLTRRIDDELARDVVQAQDQARIAALLRESLGPVTELRRTADRLMSGDAAMRCSANPTEWALIAQAHEFNVEPRDLFRPGGRVDAARLDEKLAQARLLKATLGALSCARETTDASKTLLGP